PGRCKPLAPVPPAPVFDSHRRRGQSSIQGLPVVSGAGVGRGDKMDGREGRRSARVLAATVLLGALCAASAAPGQSPKPAAPPAATPAAAPANGAPAKPHLPGYN